MSKMVTLVSALGAFLVVAGTAYAGEPIRNYSRWVDVDGSPISCHDGAIAHFGDTFYWYGTSYRGNPDGLWGRKGAHLQSGFNVYSSGNLVDWKYEGVCLEFPKTGWLSAGTSHRPNVLYNDKTGKEGSAMVKYRGKYVVAGSGVRGWNPTATSYAVAKSPLGPYREMGLMSEENTWSSQISNFLYLKESDLVVAMCDQWFRGPGGERVPIDESCQLWMPVSLDAETNTAHMQCLREWDPFPDVSEGGSQPPGSLATATGPPGRPRMYFADTVAGQPFSKDPAVVKFNGRYWLYYSLPPYEGKPTRGWSIGLAVSDNLVDWSKVGELRNTGDAEESGFCAPGAIVLDGRVHLFYQTYGNARRDAICHAWSKDGIHFTRNPTNPIFRPTGAWNCGRAIDADVIQLGDRLLLYWSTRDPDFKIQMQGVAAAPLDSDFGQDKWKQLNLDGPILKPELPWEGRCIEAAAMAKHQGRLYMFYAGSYNNKPQQVGVAASDDGVHFVRLFDEPFLPAGTPGSWNSSESGHPFLFQDDDGRDYLFYQGNNDKGRTWYLSVTPIDWKDGKPVLAPDKLPSR